MGMLLIAFLAVPVFVFALLALQFWVGFLGVGALICIGIAVVAFLMGESLFSGGGFIGNGFMGLACFVIGALTGFAGLGLGVAWIISLFL